MAHVPAPPPDPTRTAEHPAIRAAREAPPDDEPLTDEEQAAIEEGLADVRAGRVVAHDEVRRRWLGDKA